MVREAQETLLDEGSSTAELQAASVEVVGLAEWGVGKN